jgi:membrane-bound serine protease (ClpP class)
MDLLNSPLFPNLLYLLLMAGLWLATLAVVNPGTGVLEVLAFFALAGAGLGTLVIPPNWWAILILGLGTVSLVLSLRLKPAELWLGISAIAISVGSVFLFRVNGGRPAVHPLLALVVSLLTLGYFWVAIRQSILAHQARPTIDLSKVMGQVGEARTALEPTGSVYVAGELWTARAVTPIEAGEYVRVMGRDGLILMVEPDKLSVEDSKGEAGG